MNKLNEKLTYVNKNSSAEFILKNYLYSDSVLGFFNTNSKDFSSTNHKSYYFPEFNKSILPKTLSRYIDYYFIFNLTFSDNDYEALNLILKLNHSIVLVNCNIELETLKSHVGKSNIITYDEISLKENLENF